MTYRVTTTYHNITYTNYSSLSELKDIFNLAGFLSQLVADEASNSDWTDNETVILNAVNNPISESFDPITQTYTRVRDWGTAEIYNIFRSAVESKDYTIEPYLSLGNNSNGFNKITTELDT